jgi:Transcriptional regulatory protein, C terminal
LLRCNGAGKFDPVATGSRALDILGVLIERAGEVVSKDEMIAAVWPGTVVEDSNLTVQISALRRVLDRGRPNGSCIQTVPGRGYRLAAAVTPFCRSGPSFIHVSDGKLADVQALDLLLPEPGAIYVMDRGYVDFARLHTLHQAGAFFVTRTAAVVGILMVWPVCTQAAMVDADDLPPKRPEWPKPACTTPRLSGGD